METELPYYGSGGSTMNHETHKTYHLYSVDLYDILRFRRNGIYFGHRSERKDRTLHSA